MNVAEGTNTVNFDEKWVSACMRISEEAHLRLPQELHSRIEMACALAINHRVVFAEDGTCQVHSSRDDHWYTVSADTCECKDWEVAFEHRCKHVLARKITLKAQKLLQKEQAGVTLDLEPEVLEQVNTSTGEIQPTVQAQYITRLHGKPFVMYAGLLALAHERGLQKLTARFISVTSDLALAEASAEFTDGRIFTEAADATPSNCTAQVRQHFPRMALVRAKARALRDALNIGMCTLEEMGE